MDDMRQLGSASMQALSKPGVFMRELMLLVRSDPADYYAFLGDDVLEAQNQSFENPDKPLWLNLGYWKTARTYPEACADLARKLADAARLGPGDVVVDAGFGFGEQDLLWVRERNVAHIIGINVTELHVNVAKQRVEARGLGERIDLRLASATELPLAAGSVDKVVALESAFHFDTRERFFEEAARVLKPGGFIALADCMPYVGEKPTGLANYLGWRRWGVPPANIEVESIRNHVFPGMHRYAEQRQRGVPMHEARIQLSEQDVRDCVGVEAWRKQGGLTDYVIIAAQKA